MTIETGAVYDDKGRYIAPPQVLPAPRPAGPWDQNKEVPRA